METKIDLGYNLILVTYQRDLCAYGIKHGKWDGYSDALAARKIRLAEHNKEIEQIKKDIEALTGQKQLEF